MRRAALTLCVVATGALIAVGCGSRPGPDRFLRVMGSPGHTAGKFHRPRGICWDPPHNVIYVVDWDGRIQKFNTDGTFRASWLMPAVEKGKPEEVCMAGNGNLLVADTHYSRIVEFSPDGAFIRAFGSYGKEPGQFIYPVGVACDTNGNIYVSEYGENDRIQKFSADGTFIRAWGRFGVAAGEFARPSGIDIGPDGALYVSDAVNHRVQVFDTDGKLLRVIGKEGQGRGEFRYPYDVSVTSNALYVLEFGNQRIQKLALDGSFLAMAGKPGRGDGCFANPWRCELVGDLAYVSDTDNGRVVVLEVKDGE